MKVTDNLYAFIWQSMTANNCNTYFIDGPSRVLIDPGHKSFFNHVELGLKELGLAISDIDLIICTHAHLDHLESVPMLKNKKTLFPKDLPAHIRVQVKKSTIDRKKAQDDPPESFLGGLLIADNPL